MQKEFGSLFIREKKYAQNKYLYYIFFTRDRKKVENKPIEEVKDLIVERFKSYRLAAIYCRAHATILYGAKSDFTWLNNKMAFNVDNFFNEAEQNCLHRLINQRLLYTRDLQLIMFSAVMVIHNSLTKIAIYNERMYCNIFDELDVEDINKFKDDFVRKNVFMIRAYKLFIQTPLVNKMNDTYKLCYHKYRKKHRAVMYMKLLEIEYDRLLELDELLKKEGINLNYVHLVRVIKRRERNEQTAIPNNSASKT